MSADKMTKDALHNTEPPHSAFAEFSRDERRPAVMLLSALVIAAVFFALGIMVGRWTKDASSENARPPLGDAPVVSTPLQNLNQSPSLQSSPTPQTSPTPTPSPNQLSPNRHSPATH
jgi:hypothetical protein